MLSTQERDRGAQLQETAEVALENVLSTVEKAINERRELDEIFASLNTPKMVSANTVASLATPEANQEVDQKAGGVGNAFGPRLCVQSILAQRSRGLAGPDQQSNESQEIVRDPLASSQSADPATDKGLIGIARPSPTSAPEETKQQRPIFPELAPIQDHLAALLAAIRPATNPDPTPTPEKKTYSLTGLAA